MIKQLLGSLAVRPNDSNEIVENQCFNKVGTYSGIKNKALFFSFTFIFSFFGFGQSITLTNSTLSAFESCTGVVSSEQDFSISGESLTADIEIAALSGYEYSTDNTTYTATLSLPFGGGTVSATTIYVRLTSTASGTPGGNIVCSSTGATDQNVAVSGEVLSNPLTQVVLAVDDRPCGNTATGSATISLTGGDAPYTYTWTLNGSAFTASPASAPTNLSAGTYVVTVTDACGNQVASNSISVTSAPTLSLNSSVTPAQNATIACNGDQTASITAEIQGGTAPRTLTVTNTGTGTSYSSSTPTGPPSLGSFPYEVTGLPAGTYTVTASDGTSSCEDTYSSVVISEPTSLSQTNTVVDACFGASTGEINVTVSGGTAGYTYSWSGPNSYSSTDEDITGLAAGDYTLTVEDANNCSFTGGAITVSQPTAGLSIATDAVTNVGCFGTSTGEINVTVSGGTAGYTYSWSGPNSYSSTDEDITGLAAGDYTLTVEDANNCSFTGGAITVSQPTALSIATGAVTNVGCFGTSTGEINVTVSGGTAGYTYSWSGPNSYSSTDEDITGLAAGTSTGEINVTVSGGTAGYTYSWSGPNSYSSTDEDITGLAAGDYTLTVEDANNCSFTGGAITVSQPTAGLSIATDAVTNVGCFGTSTGEINVTVSGGTAGYTYSWSGPNSYSSTDEDITGLAAGDYTLTVEDANNCSFTGGAITVSQPTAGLSIATDAVTNVGCFGTSTGEINVTVSGGTAGYTYSWSGPNSYSSTDEDITGLAAGDYTLTVEDANNCSFTGGAITVSQPTAGLSIATDAVTNVGCFGTSTGEINVTVSGGTAGYTYSWSGPNSYSSTDEDITGLAAGDYTLTVEDANNCSFTGGAITVSQPTALSIATGAVTNVGCFGTSTGEINVTVSGGTAGYTYSWSGPNSYSSTDEDITGLAAGDYTLTVEDANNCSFTGGAITVSQPTAGLSIATDAVTNVGCFGTSTGEINVTVSGGTAGYTYSWSGPNSYSSTDEDITGLAAGDYTLTVEDANNCSFTGGAITVSQPTAGLSIATDAVTNVGCFGTSTGEINVTVSGGTAGYTYSWSGPNSYSSTDEDITGLAAGDYTLTVEDANNCSFTGGAITVSQPTADCQ
jgi:hypothetical protein